jgi:capsid protein
MQHRLTKTALASARAALMQAYRTFHVAQELCISQCEQPWAESVITEDIARGRLAVGTDDLDAIFSLRFNRPSKQFPDPVREVTAAKLWIDLGKSPSAVFAEQGLDHEMEVLQNAQDRAFMAAHNVPLNTGTGPAQGGDTNNGQDATIDGQDAQTNDPADPDPAADPPANARGAGQEAAA